MPNKANKISRYPLSPAGYTYPFFDDPILEAGTVTSAQQALFSSLLSRYASRNCEYAARKLYTDQAITS